MQFSYETITLIALISAVCGYIFFLVMKLALPKRLRSEHIQQQNLVIEKAQQRRQQILEENRNRTEQKLKVHLEEVDDQLQDLTQDLEATEEELASQEDFAQKEAQRIDKLESQIKEQRHKVDSIEQTFKAKTNELQEHRRQLQLKLAEIAECDIDAVRNNLANDLVTQRTLESQKVLKALSEDLHINNKKLAERSLARLLSRYEPEFIWPKAVNHVEITNHRLLEQLEDSSNRILEDLRELTDQVDISIANDKEHTVPVIKLGGGYGIDKEAARLTLEELVAKGPNAWGKVAKVYEKQRRQLFQQAEKLGARAVRELRLEGIHPEIQRMVGALNWRTSYRQNQFFHSLEVAKLAGILATELGEDPELAKRCGLLHDIGKGIDYRIEGSHAVISGDYADRFGESRIICDTVMSHHNDLVLETPLSYVLKSADTLSGARPGARVNLEEGYQVRLSAIEDVVRSFPGINKLAIMNGGREVHIDVNYKKVKENELREFTEAIARKIEQDVAFPGQIKVLVSRKFESIAVA